MKRFLLFSIAAVMLASACTHKLAPTAPAPPLAPAAPMIPDKPTGSTGGTTAAITAGNNIYVTKCTQCHAAKRADRFTLAEWKPILDNMAQRAHLDETEKANVWAYVQANAKAGS